MSLQKFRILEALSHAMRFPGVLRISYSTCSIYREENEDVVQKVMPLAEELGFELAKCLPKWPRRGFAWRFWATDAKVVPRKPVRRRRLRRFLRGCVSRGRKRRARKSSRRLKKKKKKKRNRSGGTKNKRDLESEVVVVRCSTPETRRRRKRKTAVQRRLCFAEHLVHW